MVLYVFGFRKLDQYLHFQDMISQRIVGFLVLEFNNSELNRDARIFTDCRIVLFTNLRNYEFLLPLGMLDITSMSVRLGSKGRRVFYLLG
jgi:hypothetical protein